MPLLDSNITDLKVQADGGVVRLTLNRPDKHNALSHELVTELRRVLTIIAEDNTARVVVLAAEGPTFCAGHDLSEMVGRTETEYRQLFGDCTEMMFQIRQLPQPVIARVQGLATAAGCQLVAACDLAVAAKEAAFATPGVKIGLFCSTPMVPLVRTIAPRAALEMLLTGQPISASRAYELSLVNRVVPLAKLDAEVTALADSILASSPSVIRLGKTVFYEELDMPEKMAYQKATDTIAAGALLPKQAQEGISAFLEKRPPQWPVSDPPLS